MWRFRLQSILCLGTQFLIIVMSGKQIAFPSLGFFLGFKWFGPYTKEHHHGMLFNETPPPPKQKMNWED
jgi:hypothetical protein